MAVSNSNGISEYSIVNRKAKQGKEIAEGKSMGMITQLD
jgi:hypothetical protein